MVTVMSEVGVKLDRAELRIRFEILYVAADIVQRGVIVRDVERNRVDIPIVQ
jgi:hypothetical protein